MRGRPDQIDLDHAIGFVDLRPARLGQHYLLTDLAHRGFEGSDGGVSALRRRARPSTPTIRWPIPPRRSAPGRQFDDATGSIEGSMRGAAPTPARNRSGPVEPRRPAPVCRHGGADAFTTGSMYAALGGAAPPLLRFTIGPPAPGAYADMP